MKNNYLGIKQYIGFINLEKLKIVSILIILFCVPPYFFVAFDFDSLAPGLIVSSFVISLILWKEIKNLSVIDVFIITSIILLLICDSLISLFFFGYKKPILSTIFIVPFICSILISKVLCRSSTVNVISSLNVLCFAVLILGFLSIIFPFSPGNYGALEKDVFPFYEQSHYALALGILAFPVVLTSSGLYSLFLIIMIFSLGLLFPNLTMIVFAIALTPIALARYGSKIYYSLILLLFLVILLIVLTYSDKLDYFLERINFLESENLTALVYLQGWQLLIESLKDSNGVGIGFQMLGSNIAPNVPATDVIQALYGKSFNLEDGGFLAAKLISEFGIFGILLVTSFVLLVIVFYIKVTKIYLIWYRHPELLISVASIVGFLVELMLRGVGYFSPSLIWFISMVFYFFYSRGRVNYHE